MAAQTNDGPFFLDRKHRRLLIYGRIGTLGMLNFYLHDGLPYSDIKGALGLPDGSLGPNIKWLKDHEFIEPQGEKEDGGVAVYRITTKGKEAYDKVKEWLFLVMGSGKAQR